MKNPANRSRSLAAIVLIAGESPELFGSLITVLIAEHRPETESEMMLIETLAVNNWRRMRLQRMETVQKGKLAKFVRLSASRLDSSDRRNPGTLRRLRAGKKAFLQKR